MRTGISLFKKNHTPTRIQRAIFLGALLLFVMTVTVVWNNAGQPSWAVSLDCGAVQQTPYFTIAYGHVQIDHVDAAPGTQVEAYNPRGDLVGCFVVQTEGLYGAMFVYGEDASITPPIPGMRHGESVLFRVDGVNANAEPILTWANDLDLHEITLAVGGEATPEPTQTPTQTITPPTPSPTDTTVPPTPSPTDTTVPFTPSPTDTIVPLTPSPTTPMPTETATPSPSTPTPSGPRECAQCTYLPMILQ